MVKVDRVALLGFGEASKTFLQSWAEKTPEIVSVFDTKTDVPATRETKLLEYIEHSVQGTFNAKDAIQSAQVIFSLVTADQADEALKSVESALTPKQLYLDCNSCAPQLKKALARRAEKQYVDYIDVAIMAPVLTSQPQTPIYVSGPKADEAEPFLSHLGFDVTIISDKVGDASSIKMLRSVMVKGLEALTTECMLAACKLGVEEHVVNSLAATYPGLPLEQLSHYHMERMLVHGERRNAELQQVASTLNQLNISSSMVNGAMNWHRALGTLPISAEQLNFKQLTSRILGQLEQNTADSTVL